MHPEGQRLAEEFAQCISVPASLSSEAFEAFALRLFRYQYQHNDSYRAYCRHIGKQPSASESIDRWKAIPPLPTDAFKFPDHPIITSECDQHFLTSGTTGDVRGRHDFPELATYEKSIVTSWQALELPDHARLAFLGQSPQDSPHSSLAYMMGCLAKDKPSLESPFLISSEGKFELSPLLTAIDQGQPVILFGTALAFLNLMELWSSPIPLPQGSHLIETGGYKGSGRQIEKADFYHQLTDFFAVDTEAIWNEYSMTELSSQAYCRGLNQPHRTPPWMKVQVIDIETRQPVAPEESGFLIIHDLANLHSCAAIETQDLAIYHDEHHFTLIGRDPAALPRGCSRASDHLLRS